MTPKALSREELLEEIEKEIDGVARQFPVSYTFLGQVKRILNNYKKTGLTKENK